MRPTAYIYTCRNPGQTSLLWAHQPPPFGHGWIDVKRVGLMREDEVEVQLAALNERLRLLMDAKNHWADRARAAELSVVEGRALLVKCLQRFQKEMYDDPITDRIGRFIDTTA
jgi:hypothetical protein